MAAFIFGNTVLIASEYRQNFICSHIVIKDVTVATRHKYHITVVDQQYELLLYMYRIFCVTHGWRAE